jgi:hyperosmotically inducible periplasmic protein
MKSHIGLLFLGTALATLLIAGCNKPPETSNTQPSATVENHINDSDVNQAVRSALVMDEALKGFRITAVTTNGDVNLTGVVDNQGQSDYADKLVRGIEGVHTIHNHLSIKK